MGIVMLTALSSTADPVSKDRMGRHCPDLHCRAGRVEIALSEDPTAVSRCPAEEYDRHSPRIQYLGHAVVVRIPYLALGKEVQTGGVAVTYGGEYQVQTFRLLKLGSPERLPGVVIGRVGPVEPVLGDDLLPPPIGPPQRGGDLRKRACP